MRGCEAKGSATVRLGVRDFEIHWISRGFLDFWISGFESGFSGFQSGFLDNFQSGFWDFV